MKFRQEIQELAAQFDEEEDAASDLWSWLPSHKAAEACHGDYAHEFRPSISAIMIEAAMYLAFLTGYDKSEEQKSGWFECPCGECEGPNTCCRCSAYADMLGRCRAVEGAPHCDQGKPHATCPFMRGNGGLVTKP